MSKKYFSIVLRAMLTLLWVPSLAFAGVVAVVDPGGLEILNVPLVVVIVNCVFSTLAGGTTLAIRVNAELMNNPDRPLPRPWLFCLAHMLGSWLAGTFFFLVAQHQQAGIWMGFGFVLLGSFGGAKLLELAVEKYLPMGPRPLV